MKCWDINDQLRPLIDYSFYDSRYRSYCICSLEERWEMLNTKSGIVFGFTLLYLSSTLLQYFLTPTNHRADFCYSNFRYRFLSGHSGHLLNPIPHTPHTDSLREGENFKGSKEALPSILPSCVIVPNGTSRGFL